MSQNKSTALPKNIDSFSSWRLRRAIVAKVTVIFLIDVDGVVLTNAVLHHLHDITTSRSAKHVSPLVHNKDSQK